MVPEARATAAPPCRLPRRPSRPQTPTGASGGVERVLDKAGTPVVRYRPADEPSAVAIDHGCQVQVRPLDDR
jgi:hypothetical protein